jgi:hypothetical protein
MPSLSLVAWTPRRTQPLIHSQRLMTTPVKPVMVSLTVSRREIMGMEGERDAPDDRSSPVGTQTEGLDGYQNQRLHPSCIPASMSSLTFSHPNRSKK